MRVANMQGLALPGLGRMKNGQSQLRASTFYKMVHFVSMLISSFLLCQAAMYVHHSIDDALTCVSGMT